jgi:hypothetical protein
LAKAHRIIFNPIRDRDAKAAETWMHRHMVDSRRGYELAHLNMEKDRGSADAVMEGEERGRTSVIDSLSASP